jgi:DUF4097 and DUF4098 domain-containing protein YvlB
MRNIAAIMLVLLFVPLAVAQTTVDETRPVEPEGAVYINNIAGSVVVEPWDKPEVHVSGSLESNVERVDISTSEGRVDIKVVLHENVNQDTEAQLELQVPDTIHLNITTVSASVTVRDGASSDPLFPRVEVTTVSGDTTVEVPTRELFCTSVSGAITTSGALETQTFQNVSGSITSTASANDVTAKTVSGNARLDGDAFSKVRVESVSGDIAVSGSLKEGGEISGTTVSGDLCFRPNRDLSAKVHLSTNSGGIRTSGEGWPAPEKQLFSKTLRATIGTGAGSITLKSTSGNVAILDTVE